MVKCTICPGVSLTLNQQDGFQDKSVLWLVIQRSTGRGCHITEALLDSASPRLSPWGRSSLLVACSGDRGTFLYSSSQAWESFVTKVWKLAWIINKYSDLLFGIIPWVSENLRIELILGIIIAFNCDPVLICSNEFVIQKNPPLLMGEFSMAVC